MLVQDIAFWNLYQLKTSQGHTIHAIYDIVIQYSCKISRADHLSITNFTRPHHIDSVNIIQYSCKMSPSDIYIYHVYCKLHKDTIIISTDKIQRVSQIAINYSGYIDECFALCIILCVMLRIAKEHDNCRSVLWLYMYDK